ncbi:MAG: VIT1/CCC1 transporter family protein [Planctomycetaceae bacterium]|nr:VIT1/CCC1 transporter family protein [Planctomycetaceae bacterium]
MNSHSPNSQNSQLEKLRDEHTPDAVRARLNEGPNHSYLKDFVYGAIDGAVTTFAIVSRVAGAGLSSGVVIVLGVANLIGACPAPNSTTVVRFRSLQISVISRLTS